MKKFHTGDPSEKKRLFDFFFTCQWLEAETVIKHLNGHDLKYHIFGMSNFYDVDDENNLIDGKRKKKVSRLKAR